MSGLLYDHNGDPLYLGTYHGTVVDNADPNKIARVKVVVPGFIEPSSGWALPKGGAGSTGAKGLGGYDVPPIGASVVVSFLAGNIDAPQYEGAWHGLDEQLSVVPTDPKDADKIKVFESARFLIVLNGVRGSEELLIKDKTSGDMISMKPSEMRVQATSKITVNAPNVFLGEDTGSEFVAKGETLQTYLNALAGKLTAHGHPVSGAVAGVSPGLLAPDIAPPTVTASNTKAS